MFLSALLGYRRVRSSPDDQLRAGLARLGWGVSGIDFIWSRHGRSAGVDCR